MGSASELDYHLLLSKDLGLLEAVDYQNYAKSLTEVRKMLASLLTTVEIETAPKAKSMAKR